MAILEGLLIGLATLFIVGPVVFILINATFQNGIKSGISVALGIFLSDLIFAILCVTSLESFLNNDFLGKYLSIIGFVILFSFGCSYLLKKQQINIKDTKTTTKTYFQNFIKGFSINFFNPFVFSFWILISKYGMNKYSDNLSYFLLSIVLGVLLIDVIKVSLAKKIHPLVSSKKMHIFYKISGMVMLLFSFRIVYHYISV